MNIAILSRNPALYSTQSLLRASRKRHHYTRVINYTNCDIIIENGKMVLQYHGEDVTKFDAIIPRIGASFTQFGSAIIRQYEALGVFSTLPSKALLDARNKLTCLQILARGNIGIPKSIVSNNPYLFGPLLREFEQEKVIIKLLNGTHGVGVLLPDTKKQAEVLMETFHKFNHEVLMQEFIKESNGSDIRVFIVGGNIVGCMERKAKEGEFRSNLHRGGSSRIVNISDAESEAALKAVDLLGLRVAGVDMLRSDRGPLILEVNASPGLEGIEMTTGEDIAGKIIELIENSVKRNG